MGKSAPRRPARWPLQDARNRFSEVIDAALRGQPQVVTRRGIETAVIISHAEYQRITAAHRATREPLASYLLDVPRTGAGDDDPLERITLRPRRGV
jgi:antitoxin Phd